VCHIRSTAVTEGLSRDVAGVLLFFLFLTLVTGPRRFLSLKLSYTRVCEPQIRARLSPVREWAQLYGAGTRNCVCCVALAVTWLHIFRQRANLKPQTKWQGCSRRGTPSLPKDEPHIRARLGTAAHLCKVVIACRQTSYTFTHRHPTRSPTAYTQAHGRGVGAEVPHRSRICASRGWSW
jgi:hypothetical protein